MTVAKHYSASTPHIREKEPSWFLVILLSGIISGVLLFTIGWYISLTDAQKQVVTQKIMSAGDIFPGIVGFNRSKIFLVMGVDMPPKGSKEDYKYVRTDTMMLVRMEPGRGKVNIVSIPRDCKVYIPNHGVDKINAAFTYGGPELAVETVEQTFGIDVHNYLAVNTRGVREVVDALDGIDIYVDKPMHYRDRTAGLYIDLEPGKHHMDGKTAEGFLRFRHDALGDIGRIRRQQQFLAATSAKLKDPSILLKIKPLIDASNEYVMTDFSPQDLIRLVLFGKDLKTTDFQVATVPGHPSTNTSVSYWVIDPEPAEEVLNRMIVGIREEEPASPEEAPSVGILYTANNAPDLEALQAKLEERGFTVKCKLQMARTGTKLIIHNNRQSRRTESRLQKTTPALNHAQLIFSPHGATFETNSCGRTDYTVILGNDTRRAESL